jgi:DNA-binding MarR family transcriptional regulator
MKNKKRIPQKLLQEYLPKNRIRVLLYLYKNTQKDKYSFYNEMETSLEMSDAQISLEINKMKRQGLVEIKKAGDSRKNGARKKVRLSDYGYQLVRQIFPLDLREDEKRLLELYNKIYPHFQNEFHKYTIGLFGETFNK